MNSQKSLQYDREEYRRKFVYPFLKRAYRLLKDHPEIVELKRLRTVQGWHARKISGDLEIIEIDYRKQFLPTLVHEILHHFHPDWSETRTLSEESKLINTLTLRQVENIFIAYGDALKRLRKPKK